MEELEKKTEERRLKNDLALSAQIKAIYNRLVQQFTRIVAAYNYSDSVARVHDVWYGNGHVKKDIEQYLKTFSQEVEQVINKMVAVNWELAENKQDAIIMMILQTSAVATAGVVVYDLFNRVRPKFDPLVIITGSPVNIPSGKTVVTLKDILSSPRNLEALKAFQSRQIDGLNLSKRVWNLALENKNMIEELLANSILEGQSAGQSSILLNQYLQNPGMLFRRVRNKLTGELELSARAKAFHPGKGVYRSSRQNAMRLSITESNIAFHTANHNRRLSNSMIVGYEVVVSKTNHPITDICDHLAGRYPKEFKFVSWHPLCRCHTVDILVSDEEFDKYLPDILKGGDTPIKSRNTVKSVPDGFSAWIDANAERSKGWASQPYFIRDNFAGGIIEGGLKLKMS